MRVGRTGDDDAVDRRIGEYGVGLDDPRPGFVARSSRCAEGMGSTMYSSLTEGSEAAFNAYVADATGTEYSEFDHFWSPFSSSSMATQRRSFCDSRTESTTSAVCMASRNDGQSG